MPHYQSLSVCPFHGVERREPSIPPVTKKPIVIGRHYDLKLAQMPPGRMAYEMGSPESQSTSTKDGAGRCPTRPIW